MANSEKSHTLRIFSETTIGRHSGGSIVGGYFVDIRSWTNLFVKTTDVPRLLSAKLSLTSMNHPPPPVRSSSFAQGGTLKRIYSTIPESHLQYDEQILTMEGKIRHDSGVDSARYNYKWAWRTMAGEKNGSNTEKLVHFNKYSSKALKTSWKPNKLINLGPRTK